MCCVQELRQEIEAKLCHVQKIHFEPRLLSLDDDRLKPREQSGKRSPHIHKHITAETIHMNRLYVSLQKCVCVFVFVSGSYDYLYRMRALDAIRDTGKICRHGSLFVFVMTDYELNYSQLIHKSHRFLSTDLPFHELGGTSASVTGRRLRTWLLELRNSHCMFQDSMSYLIDSVLDGYNKARHGAEVSVSLSLCAK